MDREGIYTARSAREIGADGEGKAGGSNAEKPPRSPESLLDVQPDNGNFQSSASPDTLDIQPDNGAFRSSSPDSALRERELHELADQPETRGNQAARPGRQSGGTGRTNRRTRA